VGTTDTQSSTVVAKLVIKMFQNAHNEVLSSLNSFSHHFQNHHRHVSECFETSDIYLPIIIHRCRTHFAKCSKMHNEVLSSTHFYHHFQNHHRHVSECFEGSDIYLPIIIHRCQTHSQNVPQQIQKKGLREAWKVLTSTYRRFTQVPDEQSV